MDDSSDNHCAFSRDNAAFLTQQIITYLGNKRSLLQFISSGIEQVKTRLGKSQLSCCDLFAGSGVVSRLLKQHASVIYSNDLESYSSCINRCYLSNSSELSLTELSDMLHQLKENITQEWQAGLITELYAAADDTDIQAGERLFYTRRNAIYIDTARQLIAKLPVEKRHFFLAPLLYAASVHNNTSGVFKGFYKNRQGIGQFGGEGRNALSRITKDIELALPVFSSFDCDVHLSQLESLDAVRQLPEIDFCYMDPPYNQHPYGSNYFMLNLIVENQRPENISTVSGIPQHWQRSAYNKAATAKTQLFQVIEKCPAKFILLSYNSEGFLSYDDMMNFLKTLGNVTTLESDYNAFRGSRNLSSRPLMVKEYLFLLERK